jgi:hypothetical protein
MHLRENAKALTNLTFEKEQMIPAELVIASVQLKPVGKI